VRSWSTNRCSATRRRSRTRWPKGLGAHLPVDVVEVGAAPTVVGDDVALLVVGGPTHAFGMSRQGTRQDAGKQAEHGLVSAGIGLREWLAAVHESAGSVAATAFDTRIERPWLPGSAARGREAPLAPGLQDHRAAGELLRHRDAGAAPGRGAGAGPPLGWPARRNGHRSGPGGVQRVARPAVRRGHCFRSGATEASLARQATWLSTATTPSTPCTSSIRVSRSCWVRA
jgi:hypothetical protein